MNARETRRYAVNLFAFALSGCATAIGLIFLVWILAVTVIHGMAALGPHLFTEMTPPPGSAGGLANAIFGSALIIGMAVLAGAPVGILAGTWLSEFGRLGKAAETLRFVNDILLSAPSIIIGLFVYEIAVSSVGHFSAWAGALSLAFILLPVVVRTADETMRLVPVSLREAALALGAPQWRVVVQVIYPAARTGMVTGLLLGIARISGETAPLLFTALNNQYWSANVNQPMANIPVVIFQFALSPYDQWHTLAWAAALLMTLFVLILSIAARTLLRTRSS